ncbi:MAG: ATP-binding protein [Candidatus Binatus sp.]
MGRAFELRERLEVDAPSPASRLQGLRDRALAIAELGAGMLAAERCVIAFRSSVAGADEVVCAPSGESRWDAIGKALLGALDNRIGDAFAADDRKRAPAAPDSVEIERVALSARDIEAIALGGQLDVRRQIAASAFTDGASAVRIVMVTRADRTREELEASLELMARAVFGEIALIAARDSLDFWRTHGAENGRRAVGAKRELDRERAETNRLDEAVASAQRARPDERFGRFGELVAGGAGFGQWIVAIADGGSFIVAASSSGQKQFELGESGSALAESFRRHIVIARWRDRDSGMTDSAKQFSEDRILGGSYVCIPFEAGAIALGSSDVNASAARAEELVERLAPLVAGWVMERDASRRSALMRQLTLRMFAAVDQERARIARDLHDDQAQLIAAAKIALEGRGDAAREILKQVEQELRRKTRELRPATIGNASLGEAIDREFGRLKRAGVKATLVGGEAVDKISRPVQQLCFQVVRETLSNVIRHARAKAVQIAIEKIDAAARVSVTDDGCGIVAGHSDGIGLAGVRERLELMGGSLTVESRPGRTMVVAEIPEYA